tara:strand:- start:181 stop:639 length:459 start_codon:yes stop_codon:yes gene_type:complete
MRPFERYKAYIFKLEKAGKSLPVNQYGDINFTKIASECGMRRQWFSENSQKVFDSEGKTLNQIIHHDLQALGSEVPKKQDIEEKISKDSEQKEKENSKLRKMLNLKLSEIEMLKEENAQLKSELTVLKAKNKETIEQTTLLTDTGRNFLWKE